VTFYLRTDDLFTAPPASPVQKKSCGGYFYSGEELVSRTTRAAKP
jgi:hypothetical protein